MPHVADPEKSVSLFSWAHASRHSQRLSMTTNAVTAINASYQSMKAKSSNDMQHMPAGSVA